MEGSDKKMSLPERMVVGVAPNDPHASVFTHDSDTLVEHYEEILSKLHYDLATCIVCGWRAHESDSIWADQCIECRGDMCTECVSWAHSLPGVDEKEGQEYVCYKCSTLN